MKLSVAAIEQGTVIDHIPAGYGMEIVKLLKLAKHNQVVTLGLNLASKTLTQKDLIKVEGREISKEEASQIAIFAPSAKINIIRNFKVVDKFTVTMPSQIERWVVCPNKNCITNHERMQTRFTVHRFGETVELKCHFCERIFAHDH